MLYMLRNDYACFAFCACTGTRNKGLCLRVWKERLNTHLHSPVSRTHVSVLINRQTLRFHTLRAAQHVQGTAAIQVYRVYG